MTGASPGRPFELAVHSEAIARALLGEPNPAHSTKAQLRYGTNGSLSVQVRGPNRGTWYDFENKKGGGLLELIAREKGINGAAAFEWLRSIGVETAPPTPRQLVATYVYRDADGNQRYRVLRCEPKDFTQASFDPKTGAYVGGKRCMTGVELFPYRLNEWAGRASMILVVEGEKAADRLVAAGITATCSPGGAGKWRPAYSAWLAGKDVVVLPDNDQAGRDHARQVAESVLSVALRVRVLELPDLPPKGDAFDWFAAGGTKEALLQLIEKSGSASAWLNGDALTIEELLQLAKADPGAPFEHRAVAFLAALQERDPAGYHRLRAAFKKLSISVTQLERLIEERHPKPAPAATTIGHGQLLEFPEVEPWETPVGGAEHLDAMVAHLQRFAVLPSVHAARAVVLWAQHTHVIDAAVYTPRLAVSAPTKECGKSVVMAWLAGVVHRPFEVIDPTGPTLFRPIEAHHPTVLIDEGDLVSWDERHDVRMVINAGHCRFSPGVPRCVGEDFEVRIFNVWAPLAYAMIGRPPDTILSRSVQIVMARMAPGQKVEQRRLEQDQGFSAIRSKCFRWAADHIAALRQADPDISLSGRKADCWRALIAIADEAGGDWPKNARDAANALSGVEDTDAEPIGVRALAACRSAFTKADGSLFERLTSVGIVGHMHGLEGEPWAEFGPRQKADHADCARPPASAVRRRPAHAQVRRQDRGQRLPLGAVHGRLEQIFTSYPLSNRNPVTFQRIRGTRRKRNRNHGFGGYGCESAESQQICGR
jgi:hypothetical protein